MAVIDLPCDRGFVCLSRLIGSLPKPYDFVKEASVESCCGADLPRQAFADVIGKKFPMHTKAAAFISYLYFQDQKGKFTKEAAARIETKFASAAKIWGIKTEMEEAAKLFTPAVEKTASASSYALNVQGRHFFPIDTPTNITKSASELVQYRGNFTYAMRKEAATAIMRAATQCGLGTVNLPDELHYMGGFGLCNKTAAVNEIARRKLFAEGAHSPLAECMDKLANDLGGTEKLTPETMTKVAEIVDVFDRELKVTELYGKNFAFPEDVFFGAFTEKTAAHIKKSTVSTLTGRTYTYDQLSKAADAMRVFGDDFYGEVVRKDGTVDLAKVADALPTMPRDSAALFDRAMASITNLIDKGI